MSKKINNFFFSARKSANGTVRMTIIGNQCRTVMLSRHLGLFRNISTEKIVIIGVFDWLRQNEVGRNNLTGPNEL